MRHQISGSISGWVSQVSTKSTNRGDMNSRLWIFCLLILSCISTPALAQLAPQWHGVWKSEDGKLTVKISGDEVEYLVDAKDENGKPETRSTKLKWTNRSDDAAGKLESVFGYSKKRVSLGEISRKYEESLRQYRKDPTDFTISDPSKARALIGAMSFGVYKVMWSYSGGDCGYDEYILDGDRILDITDCKYRHEVQLFTRLRK